jgi:hypothetical protein
MLSIYQRLQIYPTVRDIFNKALVNYDIVLCTLTLHHFKEREIFDIISVFNANAALELSLMIYKEASAPIDYFNLLCLFFD